VIDDDEPMREVLEAELTRRKFQVASCASAAAALQLVDERAFDAVVTDLSMPGMTGADLCSRIGAKRPGLPVIVITAHGSMDGAMLAMRAGACDFLTKPLAIDDLVLTIDRALNERALREEVKELRDQADGARGFGEMVGSSAPMQKVYDLISRVSESDTSVLITGESGTGKELVARTLHQKSRRKNGPFVAINCAAVPETLLESELFGHVRGAFTDARQDRAGLFMAASKGTLFLDEIGEVPLGVQSKLLRALQERTVRPVGGENELGFDTRVIAATNRDLEADVQKKRFREDLLYRINVIQVHVPPLRARGSDILLLAHHYLQRHSLQRKSKVLGMTAGAAAKLATYPWPGNVRELSNCIERAVALAPLDQIGVDDLPETIRDYNSKRVVLETGDPKDFLPMQEVERRYVLHVLERVGGNRTKAAKVLGLDRRSLTSRLRLYGMDKVPGQPPQRPASEKTAALAADPEEEA
jgi:two-component system, NtrC family, response regulator AtoC